VPIAATSRSSRRERFRDPRHPRPDESNGEQPQLREDGVLAADEQAGGRGRAAFGRLSASRLGTVIAIEAIVRQDDRRPSNGATGGGRPLLLPNA
jgi:hypothetical protein